MKQNIKKMQLQDLFIGAWVCWMMEPIKDSRPICIRNIYGDGWVELDFEGNEDGLIKLPIEEIQGVQIRKSTMLHLGFVEKERDVVEMKCDNFKVLVYTSNSPYATLKVRLEHDDGGYQVNENILFVHQLQRFIFDSTRKPFVLRYKE